MTVACKDIQRFLETSIPISSQMKFQIDRCNDNELRINAPLRPNTNDKGTAFAGSLYSAMVLAGWTFISSRLISERIDGEVAVISSDVKFLQPVTADFQTVCTLPDPTLWDVFVAKLQKRKNYKIQLQIDVLLNGQVKAQMNAEYIAWLKNVLAFSR